MEEQPWLMLNVVDRGMMGRAVQRVLDGSNTKIGVHSLNMVSNAVQKHLKNVLEAAFKVAKSRVNKTAFNSYEGENPMLHISVFAIVAVLFSTIAFHMNGRTHRWRELPIICVISLQESLR